MTVERQTKKLQGLLTAITAYEKQVGKYNEELKLTDLSHDIAHKGEECSLPMPMMTTESPHLIKKCSLPKELDPAAFIPDIAIMKFDV
ncbi:hypothetical protein CDAR_39581 [Caerostris darwini]|uniref:Uncharacterized protein n=1 Tax=Caerostris darwini TaxID=1538125 RepID=A0AAV4U6K5_9ARAC|nr:hypothetical protein CDAR_39581 [Caerostris darwini]